MSKKSVFMTGAIIGSTIGGAVPLIWGDSYLSFSSVILTAVGGFVGIYIAHKITKTTNSF